MNPLAEAERIRGRCLQLASISETTEGILRSYLSAAHKQCNQQVATWMQSIGMMTWQDEVGNQWGRLTSEHPNAKQLILGSHLDTVPNAGAYDGILGVILAIEVAEALVKEDVSLPFHLDIVGFCDEEGTRFGTTLIGSSAITGQFDPSWLNIKDAAGITMAQAMQDFGLNPKQIDQAALNPAQVLGYIETHIEQGPMLESQEASIGVVTAIAGARRAKVEFTGQPGHAGTTPMHLRLDAAVAASEWILAVEQLALSKTPDLVATVGEIKVAPGAVNVIAGHIELSLDIRSQNDILRDECCLALTQKAELIAQQRGLTSKVTWFHEAPAVNCDHFLKQQLSKAVKTCSLPLIELPSGAGHDAMAIADFTKMAMLFIRSPKGISHHPDEEVVDQDVQDAFRVITQFLSTACKYASFFKPS